MARLIDGKALAAALREQVAAAAARLRERHGVVPGLAAILVGDDPASQVYVRSKARACARRRDRLVRASPAGGLRHARAAGADRRAQRRRPGRRHPGAAAAAGGARPAAGSSPRSIRRRTWTGFIRSMSAGCGAASRALSRARRKACCCCCAACGPTCPAPTPSCSAARRSSGVRRRRCCSPPTARSRSSIRRPRTPPRSAAAPTSWSPRSGGRRWSTADWIKPGAIVIDVGINRIAGADGTTRLVGDVDFAAARQVAGAITPVPGGVGPMTIACLLRNTVLAAYRRRGLPDPAARRPECQSSRPPTQRGNRVQFAACSNRRLCLNDEEDRGHDEQSSNRPGLCGRMCARLRGDAAGEGADSEHAACLTNGPQASTGDFGDWSAPRNNTESAHYERLLQTSPGFRHARMRKECGPITDAQLRAQCMASFGEFAPIWSGSSMPPSQELSREAPAY